jgi:hypothetical protein
MGLVAIAGINTAYTSGKNLLVLTQEYSNDLQEEIDWAKWGTETLFNFLFNVLGELISKKWIDKVLDPSIEVDGVKIVVALVPWKKKVSEIFLNAISNFARSTFKNVILTVIENSRHHNKHITLEELLEKIAKELTRETAIDAINEQVIKILENKDLDVKLISLIKIIFSKRSK